MFGPHGQSARQYGPESQHPSVAACRLHLFACIKQMHSLHGGVIIWQLFRSGTGTADAADAADAVDASEKLGCLCASADVWLPVSGSAPITIPRSDRWRAHLQSWLNCRR
jgi:hypothetical protein